MSKELNELRLRQVDELLSDWQDLTTADEPSAGWIRTIREALGMTADQLGQRMGLSRQGVADLEKREADNRVSLATLEEAAEALGGELVYAIVPRISLAEMRREQAHQRAAEELARVSHSMRLESQSVSQKEFDRQLAGIEQRWLDSWSRRLWDSVK